MEGEDTVFFLVAAGGSFLSLRVWIRRLAGPMRFRPAGYLSFFLAVVLLCCLFLIFLSLRLWADHEVKNSGGYLFLLTALGFAWITGATSRWCWPGFSLDDDAVDRNNVAAVIASCGAMGGLALIYAGGNVGEGPSLFNNVFSAGLGTILLFVLWLGFEFITRISLAIAEERDTASGIRLAGLLLGLGLIIGRSVAGTWQSMHATACDLVREGWPTLLLVIAAGLVEPACRPTLIKPFPRCSRYGIYPGVAYLCFAILYVLYLGKWK